MRDAFKSAFDGIYVEDKLKESTAKYISVKLCRRQARDIPRSLRLVLPLIILTVMLTYNQYFTAKAYVDFDVNPSVELVINRFDRVIDSRAYNADGSALLSTLSLRHRTYKDALAILVDSAAHAGYLSNDGLVSVTLQTDDPEIESHWLPSIQNGIITAVNEHTTTAQVDVFAVNKDTRASAQQQELSPAKYLAIVELMTAAPEITFDHCRGRSIGEIKQLTQEHNAHEQGSPEQSAQEQSSQEQSSYHMNHRRNGNCRNH